MKTESSVARSPTDILGEMTLAWSSDGGKLEFWILMKIGRYCNRPGGIVPTNIFEDTSEEKISW